MPFANASGATIHYTVAGTGQDTLLLLTGLGGHASDWNDAFVGEFARDHRVVLLDNRGIEQSTTTAKSWSLRDMADDALAVLDALGIARAHVLGISMGGMIAQLLAAENATRVGKLILMATSFGGNEIVHATPAAARALGPQPGMSFGEQRRQALRTVTFPDFGDAHPDLLDQFAEKRGRHPTPWPVFQAQLEALILSDRSQLVRSILAPTLVIHGADDPLIPIENGRMLSQRIGGAQLLTVEHCGHLPYLEKPVETIRAIREFLTAGR
jgi:pimeloyl-ACP methyl ester carboxylesterase